MWLVALVRLDFIKDDNNKGVNLLTATVDELDLLVMFSELELEAADETQVNQHTLIHNSTRLHFLLK